MRLLRLRRLRRPVWQSQWRLLARQLSQRHHSRPRAHLAVRCRPPRPACPRSLPGMTVVAKASRWSFARAFREHLFAAMSGGFSVPFAAAAVFLDNKYAQLIFGCLAFGSA